MTVYRAPLTQADKKLVLYINMKAKLPPDERLRAQRLVHFGLVSETPSGFSLTEAGKDECRKELRRRDSQARNAAAAPSGLPDLERVA